MSNTTKHTPTPYEITPTLTSEIPVCHDGEVICRVYKQANAAFIVKAVNAHEGLVAALEALLSADCKIFNTEQDLQKRNEVILSASKALAKAKGES